MHWRLPISLLQSPVISIKSDFFILTMLHCCLVQPFGSLEMKYVWSPEQQQHPLLDKNIINAHLYYKFRQLWEKLQLFYSKNRNSISCFRGCQFLWPKAFTSYINKTRYILILTKQKASQLTIVWHNSSSEKLDISVAIQMDFTDNLSIFSHRANLMR